jgi:hypothetical protein
MKLNNDCIRDVLLEIENQQTFNVSKAGQITYSKIDVRVLFKSLPDTPSEDIVYSVIQLKEAGYIIADISYAGTAIGGMYIHRITYEGHEFLEKIRDNRMWSNVKKGLNSIGSFGLSTISELARGLITGMITDFVTRG